MGSQQLTSDTLTAAGPARRRGTKRTVCEHCAAGRCERCVRVACFHRCPNMRRFGLSVHGEGQEHGAPKPGGGRA